MSGLLEKITETVWPWQSGPGQTLYQLISRFTPSVPTTVTGIQQVRVSLISTPGYLDSLVKDALETVKFSNGNKLPIKIKLSTRDVSSSLRYGLVQSQQTLLVSGNKNISDQFLGQVRDSILQDTRDSRMNTPRVLSVLPQNWLETTNSANSSSIGPVSPNKILGGLGLTGILVGAIAGLLLLTNHRRGTDGMSHLQEAASHLERRGFHNPQLIRQASVEEGEKFFFRTTQGECTVVVDKKGRIFSWSRIPSGGEEMS